jgi:selenocysteine lyase/cysteine desulfurase
MEARVRCEGTSEVGKPGTEFFEADSQLPCSLCIAVLSTLFGVQTSHLFVVVLHFPLNGARSKEEEEDPTMKTALPLATMLGAATANPHAWWDAVQSWKTSAAPPPAFGHPMLAEFNLDPNYTNVNQGSYGSTPTKVRQATEQLVVAAEANPDLWFRSNMTSNGNSVYINLLLESREALAAYIKAPRNETSIVDNASHGINAVLRSVPAFLEKKGILYLDLAYGEVKAAMAYMSGTFPGEPTSPSFQHPTFEVNTTSLGLDVADPALLVPLVEAALRDAGGAVGLCSFSHIVSIPAIILPIKELAAACRAAGALTLVDGAHVPGNLDLDVPSLGADFYVGNGHKHLYSSRGVCVLWARAAAQQYLFPLVIDEGGVGTAFERYFMYQGTTDDVTRYISVKAALAWREWLGEAAILEYTHGLAEKACAHLSETWGGTQRFAGAVQANMCNVELPCKADCPPGLGYTLYHKYNYYMPVFPFGGSTWVRLTATVYNDATDFEMIGRTVLAELGAHKGVGVVVVVGGGGSGGGGGAAAAAAAL